LTRYVYFVKIAATKRSLEVIQVEVHTGTRIEVTVVGQEGDQKVVAINPNEPCAQLLRAGLHALYGDPGPNPDEFDLVFQGKPIEPLSQKVEEVGIVHGSTLSILPKTISRGHGVA
jgi:hypothetical protein